MNDRTSLVPSRTALSPTQELRMPDGTPLGLGFLGSARFAAIRRVLDQAQRAAQSKAALVDAVNEIGNAYVRRGIVLEQLENLDTIRSTEADRIRIAYESQLRAEHLAKLKQELEQLELEDQIAAKRMARAKAQAAASGALQAANNSGQLAPKPDEFALLINDISRIPEVMKVAAAVKAEIVKDAGGEERLTQAQKEMVELIDVLLTSFMQKQAENRIL